MICSDCQIPLRPLYTKEHRRWVVGVRCGACGKRWKVQSVSKLYDQMICNLESEFMHMIDMLPFPKDAEEIDGK
jgi:hypothetical protein